MSHLTLKLLGRAKASMHKEIFTILQALSVKVNACRCTASWCGTMATLGKRWMLRLWLSMAAGKCSGTFFCAWRVRLQMTNPSEMFA